MLVSMKAILDDANKNYYGVMAMNSINIEMARGAIISMFTVIFILPSMLMVFDGAICKTTLDMRGKVKKTKKVKDSVVKA